MTMKSVDLPHLRSVVLAGHAGSGKTTLAEQLLFKAGAIPRLGRVDDGTAHLDFEPEEQKRKESLSLAVGTFEADGTRISLVDTPGYPDFIADVIEGFAAADGAILVMDASGGVEAGLEHGRRARPRRPARRPASSSTSATARTPTRPPPSTRCGRRSATRSPRSSWPSGRPSRSAATSTSSIARPGSWDGTTEVEIPIPDDLAAEVARRRDQLLEAAAEADDDVLTKYLEGEEITDPELEACLRKGVKESVLAPVLVGSAAKGIGLRGAARRDRPLPPLAGRRAAGRSATDKAGDDGRGRGRRGRPAPRPRVQDDRRPVRRAADLPARPVGHAPLAGARLERDRERGRADRPAAAAPRQGAGADRRAQGRRDRRGRQAGRDRDRRHAGVAREAARRCRRSTFPEPSLLVAIEPQTKGDLDKMGPALARMLEEEPTVRLERSATGEQVLRTMGEAHTAVIIERLKRKFGAAIVTHTPQVPYKETIRGKTQVHGRYKKQTGGHGMFGDVWLELEPNPDGGVEFAERVVGGVGAQGLLRRRREGHPRGGRRGRPRRLSAVRLQGDAVRRVVPPGRLERAVVQDRGVDGAQGRRPRTPSRRSWSRSWRSRSGSPRPTWARSTATSTAAAAGSSGWTPTATMQVIIAHVPQAELFTYATELRSLAQGRGSFTRDARPLRGRARRTSPRRSSRRIARSSRRPAGTAAVTDGPVGLGLDPRRRGASSRQRRRRAQFAGRRSQRVAPGRAAFVERAADDRARTADGADGPRSSSVAMPPDAMIAPRPRPTSRS